ncbi:MAG TPA: methyltransferase domain-containing protein [Solirubrobacterales bacterium]|nr:methyltransferase domain-containing protein [Solirubrobacterales bacterium]
MSRTKRIAPGFARSTPASTESGGNVYDKYGTSNPIARRLMAGFMLDLDQLVERTGAREAHEVGCGEGEISIRLARSGIRVRGTDAYPRVLEEARRRAAVAGVEIDFEAVRVEELDPERHAAELVVCCEVLEHLEDAQRGLEVLRRLASPWLIASVPREPLWRALNLARFSYVGELGNTPGHLSHWSRGGFERFLGERFEVIEVRSPIPWTMALCRVPGTD